LVTLLSGRIDVRGEDPLEIASETRSALLALSRREGWTCVEIDVAKAFTTIDLFDLLKEVLWFPSWCGSGWDSMFDAAVELREAWSFPMVLLVTGRRGMLSNDLHAGVNHVLYLDEVAASYTANGAPFDVVYVVE
jgi:hypothetical protein